MTHWDELRRAARQQRAAALAALGVADGLPCAALVLDGADQLTGYERVPVPAGDSLLYGGEAMLDLDWERIRFNAEVDPRLALFNQAHEYAHLWLHRDSIRCQANDLDAEATEEAIPLGVERVEGYGPLERREREANVFAREFLLPTDALRAWSAHAGPDTRAIAARVGLPEGLVVQQLARALLAPEIAAGAADDGEPVRTPDAHELDPTQAAAANVACGPLLVRAGPGTGKTRTLVGRVRVLLERGVPPTHILALTFSNRAAEEMRSRIAQVAPEAAPKIWMGTFHAFGLELLRKYGTHLGLPPRPTVLDPVDAVGLLERGLGTLALDHYQNLYEPTMHLRDILAAISRAKDELVGPQRYEELAEAMRAAADPQDEQAGTAAEKALEVARVYTWYQSALEAQHLLDFGDLIMRAVELLRAYPGVRDELRRTYTHVLVDEYQDVNRASGLLLREIAGDGAGLWVVGDERQAIYRFRGAAPANMRLFVEDFPGAEVCALGHNYRSQPPIVDVFSELAPRMRATHGDPFDGWQPVRPLDGGEVRMAVADDQDAEGLGLAREIQRQRTRGIAYRDQAVLCRSHTLLGRIGAALEQAGVPVLYLGDLFERPAVRDMLALLSLACEPDGRGLVRVARFPEYQIPLADVRVLLRLASERSRPFPAALRLADEAETISEAGRRGLRLLRRHLAGLTYGRHPWQLLTCYLFGRSRYLAHWVVDGSVADQQRRLALYQFLQFVHEQQFEDQFADEPVDPKRLLLRYVRQLEIFGEEKQLRQVPAWAEGIDAVRLLTVHAAKGLEWRAVYLPGLARGVFPAKRQWQRCPAPTGMIAAGPDDHAEEEECLFFVALSRARDVLCLSRARRYGKQNRGPSELLLSLADVLPHPPGGPVTWPACPPPPTPCVDPLPDPLAHQERHLDVYLRCPRQYYYEFELGLSGKREDAAYVQFHQCVYRVLGWLRDQQADGHDPTVPQAVVQLDTEWAAHGPTAHPYAATYYASARNMVERWAGRPTRSRRPAAHPAWEVRLPHGRVTFEPDHVEQLDDGSQIVERLRTGRPTKSALDDDIYALYLAAAEHATPSVPRTVQVRYLSNDHVEPVTLAPKTVEARLAKYDAAIASILRRDFPPTPTDRACPRCPNYFICPAAEDG